MSEKETMEIEVVVVHHGNNETNGNGIVTKVRSKGERYTTSKKRAMLAIEGNIAKDPKGKVLSSKSMRAKAKAEAAKKRKMQD